VDDVPDFGSAGDPPMKFDNLVVLKVPPRRDLTVAVFAAAVGGHTDACQVAVIVAYYSESDK
jgi:hypothetical protein